MIFQTVEYMLQDRCYRRDRIDIYHKMGYKSEENVKYHFLLTAKRGSNERGE